MSRGGRMRRVNELLREVIASEVVLLKDPGIGFVTVTGVESAPDPPTVAALTAWLADHDMQLADLRAQRHRLDDVFRRLTGGVARAAAGDDAGDDVEPVVRRRRRRGATSPTTRGRR